MGSVIILVSSKLHLINTRLYYVCFVFVLYWPGYQSCCLYYSVYWLCRLRHLFAFAKLWFLSAVCLTLVTNKHFAPSQSAIISYLIMHTQFQVADEKCNRWEEIVCASVISKYIELWMAVIEYEMHSNGLINTTARVSGVTCSSWID